MADLNFGARTFSQASQIHTLPLLGSDDFGDGTTLWRECPGGREEVPCQIDFAGSMPVLHWVSAGTVDSEQRYRLSTDAKSDPAKTVTGFTIEDCRYRFKVRWNGMVAAAYNFIGQREDCSTAAKIATLVDPRVNLAWVGFKPFWYPLYTPSGLRLTENSPADHPHHHSIWFGHSNINGVDCWMETGAVGKILLREIRNVAAGPVFAGWTETNWWVAPDGNKLLEEDRTHRFWHVGQGYLLDLRLMFCATEGEICFAQEKDAGLGIRMADNLDVEDGGLILNSHGDRNEAGTFDRPADWVDYSGPVTGRIGGIAVFNGPDVPAHPWFTRDYGPLLSNFMRFQSWTLPKGERLDLSFRLYLHDGSAETAHVPEQYVAFKRPPMII